MHVFQHQIEVGASAEQAYALCLDVEKWPQIFSPCKAARVIEQDARSQLVEISALVNGNLMTWRSQRALDPETRRIIFRQVQPSVLLQSMEGAWRYYTLKSGTLIVLEHAFTIKEHVSGLVDTVSTPEEALAFMTRSLHANSKRELLEIKQVLETRSHVDRDAGLCGEFEEEMVLSAPIEAVFKLLQRVGDWPGLLPHCDAVDVRYDDGQDQEFVMVVEVRGKKEHIRSVRRCTPNSSIVYFQPEPPPALRRHSGEWLLEPTGGGVRVVSRHSVELRPEGMKAAFGDIGPREALARVTEAINHSSRATMLAIKARTETRG